MGQEGALSKPAVQWWHSLNSSTSVVGNSRGQERGSDARLVVNSFRFSPSAPGRSDFPRWETSVVPSSPPVLKKRAKRSERSGTGGAVIK